MKEKYKKYIGNKAFYMMVMAIAVPIMIQNGLTNFVNLLDNIMVGRLGTEEMSGVSIVNQIIFVYNLCMVGADNYCRRRFSSSVFRKAADSFVSDGRKRRK